MAFKIILKINRLDIYKRLLKMYSTGGMKSAKAFLTKDSNNYQIIIFLFITRIFKFCKSNMTAVFKATFNDLFTLSSDFYQFINSVMQQLK